MRRFVVASEARTGRATAAQLLDASRQDLRFAVRTLRRAPGMAIACIVTIALGVGANGAMFSLVDRLFVRPPPGIRDASTVRRLYLRTSWSIGDVTRIEDRFTVPAFSVLDSGLTPRVRLAGYTPPDTMPLRVGSAISTAHGSYVTSAFMGVLGVRPSFGRFFAPDEEVMGAPVYVAVLSHSLWERAFAGDLNVLGRTVEINRQRTTIVGVAERDFTGPDLSGTDVWMPLPTMPAPSDGLWYKSFRAAARLRLVGRVAPEVHNEWIEAAATTVVRRAMMGTTNVVRDTGAVVLPGPILESLAPSVTPAPEVAISVRLVGVTLIVLLIACANVANLLLTRAIGRRREIAVRLALGVSRSRLVAQFLTEGLLLSFVAAAVALLVSFWAGTALRAIVTPDVSWSDPVLDGRVILFTVLVSLLTGLLAGLVPALQASRPELTSALRGGAREGSTTASRSRLRRTLLAAQVALCVLLLQGAGLFVRSLSKIRGLDLGFDTDRLVYGSEAFVMPDGNYLDFGREPATQQRLSSGLTEAAARLAGVPDIESVALTTGGPMLGYTMAPLFFPNGSAVPRLDQRDPAWIAATPNYLSTTGLTLVRGRFFTDADRNGPRVVVVNETAARAYWPNRDPLGMCVVFFRPTEPCATVIGVVRDGRLAELLEPATAQLFTPLGFAYGGKTWSVRFLVVRARSPRTDQIAAVVRRELQRAFPERAVPWVFTASGRLAPQLRPWRTGLLLFSAFGALALLVATFGTYSVISYAVSQRAQEMSVRVALGAQASHLLRLVLGEGVRAAAIGIAVGLVASLFAAGLLQSLLYETNARDPVVTVSVLTVLVITSLAASLLPAERAAHADPVLALRAE
jgi:predicted permease